MTSLPASPRIVLGLLVLALAAALWLFLQDHGAFSRGDALASALQPWIDGKEPDRALAARAILDNYREARTNAKLWSGVFWGFTFAAAIFSALAGVILKFESLVRAEPLKKDLAAALSVAAALLVTLSSSGDFQRKWQANRIAAAELERLGYALLAGDGADARAYLSRVGEALYRRHLAIVGGDDDGRPKPTSQPPSPQR